MKLQPRPRDVVRIDQVREEHGASNTNLRKYTVGFIGVLSEARSKDDKDFYAVHFGPGGGIWARVTILERNGVKIEQPREYVPQVGDRVRVVDVSNFPAAGVPTDRPLLGGIGIISGKPLIGVAGIHSPEVVGYYAIMFEGLPMGRWCKVEPCPYEEQAVVLGSVVVEKREPRRCYWCGDAVVDLLALVCASCGVSDYQHEVAFELYQERLAGGALDCPGERQATLRFALDQMRPSCCNCGSKEGMPDGYGSSLRRARGGDMPRIKERRGGAPVCITCVSKGSAVLSQIAKSLEDVDPEPEPGAAPHWPAQHSTPSWED